MAKKIIIVDDSESIREVVSFTLKNEGYDILTAKDGNEALLLLEDNNPDLIITDLHMPNLNGIGLIKKIRMIEKFKHLPILFLTTESQQEKKMEAKLAGATGWIIKPFSPQKLIHALRRVLR